MKTKSNNKTDNTPMQQLREIRDKVSHEIKDMTFEQLKDYFKNKNTLHPTRYKSDSGLG